MAAPPHAERVEWEFRQTRLAYRLLCVEARTQTICRLTSLSVHRLSKWRTRWGFSESERSRGPAPNSFAPFFRCPKLRVEGACIALLCDVFGILRNASGDANRFYCLTTGEQLCDLLDFHRSCYPHASISFDQLLLLARGLTIGKAIQLRYCNSCGGVILSDPLQLPRPHCDSCRECKPVQFAHALACVSLAPDTAEGLVGRLQHRYRSAF